MRKLVSSLVLALGFFVVSAGLSQAQAATYYVSPDESINDALCLLEPGDTLILRDGVYTQTVTGCTTTGGFPSGEPGNPVTIMAQNPLGATIRPSQGARFVIIFGTNRVQQNGQYIDHTDAACLSSLQAQGITSRAVVEGVHDLTIANLVLDGANITSSVIRISGPLENTTCYPDNSNQPNNIAIIGNEIMNAAGGVNPNSLNFSGSDYKFWGAGISASRANNVYYAYNIIHDNGVTDFDHGIYHYGVGGIIENNVVYNNVGTGIKVGWAEDITTRDIIVRNNNVYDNNQACTIRGQLSNAAGYMADGRGISAHRADGVEIYNNIVSGGHNAGIDAIYDVTNVTIYNNNVTVTQNCGTAVGIRASTRSSNVTIRNNYVNQQAPMSPIDERYTYSIVANSNASNVLIEGNVTACGTNPEIAIIDSATGSMINNRVCGGSQPIGTGANTATVASTTYTVPPTLTPPNSSGGPGGSYTPRLTEPPPTVECASGEIGFETAIGCIPFETQQLAVFLLRWGMGIAGGVALVTIADSAYNIAGSRGDPRKLQAARDKLIAAIGGLILLVLSVFLLRFIGVDILGIF